MKTLQVILTLFVLTTVLVAQTETVNPDSATVSSEQPTPIDTLNTGSPVTTTATDTALTEPGIQDSSSLGAMAGPQEETLAAAQPEMVMVAFEPKPVQVAGLMNEGLVYYWTNDFLMDLGLDDLPYLSFQDPTLIAIKANDCLNIVCHLLASDSTGLDYVIVGVTDSSDYKVYDTVTKVVVLEALRDSLASALDAYLHQIAGGELVAFTTQIDIPADTVMIADSQSPASGSQRDRKAWLQIKRRNFRSLDELFTNPANLARDYPAFIALNLLPDFKIGLRNSLLTPGWYKKWWTTGGHWDAATKSEYLATLQNKELILNIAPDFNTLIGFRIGRFGLNISGKSHIKLVLPGSIPTTLIPVLPMEDWTLHEPIENGGLELETIPFILKTTLSYAQPLETQFGALKVGVGVNIYEAAGYLRIISDDLTVTFVEDSVFTTASGEGWATAEGATGHIDNPDFTNLDPLNTLSDPTFGLDIGAILDLETLLHQEMELQVSIRNIAAKYSWSGLTHEAWTFEQRIPLTADTDTDSLEQYQTTTTTVIESEDNYDIKVPTVLNLAAFYQPVPQILIGAGIEKAFTDEVRFGFSPDLELYYQLNYFTTKWLDLSYYHRTKYGEPVHTFGTGFHFKHFDAGVTFSLFNGLNSDAKGIGFGLRSSMHF